VSFSARFHAGSLQSLYPVMFQVMYPSESPNAVSIEVQSLMHVRQRNGFFLPHQGLIALSRNRSIYVPSQMFDTTLSQNRGKHITIERLISSHMSSTEISKMESFPAQYLFDTASSRNRGRTFSNGTETSFAHKQRLQQSDDSDYVPASYDPGDKTGGSSGQVPASYVGATESSEGTQLQNLESPLPSFTTATTIG
jgi:hypothetical protein